MKIEIGYESEFMYHSIKTSDNAFRVMVFYDSKSNDINFHVRARKGLSATSLTWEMFIDVLKVNKIHVEPIVNYFATTREAAVINQVAAYNRIINELKEKGKSNGEKSG